MLVLSKVRNNRTSVEINMINVVGEEGVEAEVDAVPVCSGVPLVAPMLSTCSLDLTLDLHLLQRFR